MLGKLKPMLSLKFCERSTRLNRHVAMRNTTEPIKKIIKCEPCNGTGEEECPHGCLANARCLAAGRTSQTFEDLVCRSCLMSEEETSEPGMIPCWSCEGEGVEGNEEWSEAVKRHEKMNQLFKAGAKLQPSGLTPEAESFLQFIGA